MSNNNQLYGMVAPTNPLLMKGYQFPSTSKRGRTSGAKGNNKFPLALDNQTRQYKIIEGAFAQSRLSHMNELISLIEENGGDISSVVGDSRVQGIMSEMIYQNSQLASLKNGLEITYKDWEDSKAKMSKYDAETELFLDKNYQRYFYDQKGVLRSEASIGRETEDSKGNKYTVEKGSEYLSNQRVFNDYRSRLGINRDEYGNYTVDGIVEGNMADMTKDAVKDNVLDILKTAASKYDSSSGRPSVSGVGTSFAWILGEDAKNNYKQIDRAIGGLQGILSNEAETQMRLRFYDKGYADNQAKIMKLPVLDSKGKPVKQGDGYAEAEDLIYINDDEYKRLKEKKNRNAREDAIVKQYENAETASNEQKYNMFKYDTISAYAAGFKNQEYRNRIAKVSDAEAGDRLNRQKMNNIEALTNLIKKQRPETMNFFNVSKEEEVDRDGDVVTPREYKAYEGVIRSIPAGMFGVIDRSQQNTDWMKQVSTDPENFGVNNFEIDVNKVSQLPSASTYDYAITTTTGVGLTRKELEQGGFRIIGFDQSVYNLPETATNGDIVYIGVPTTLPNGQTVVRERPHYKVRMVAPRAKAIPLLEKRMVEDAGNVRWDPANPNATYKAGARLNDWSLVPGMYTTDFAEDIGLTTYDSNGSWDEDWVEIESYVAIGEQDFLEHQDDDTKSAGNFEQVLNFANKNDLLQKTAQEQAIYLQWLQAQQYTQK